MKVSDLRTAPKGAIVAYEGQPVTFVALLGRGLADVRPLDGGSKVVRVRDLTQVTAGNAPYDHDKGRMTYGPDAAIYVDSPGQVHAYWAADPAIAVRIASGDDSFDLWLSPTYEIENVAVARRCTKHDGYGFSGWIVETSGSYGDPVPTKAEAMEQLGYAVANFWNRGK